ncbi:TlpA disulfide reductase family protein [uncultured Gimesia sp.]|uniref:TlpA disulfide reductase family protein n=1 Tax=uncultured Gimesia sp. TaxID=1678688 RepID=UPI00260669D7|nr:TlpA disulfide reductase family protein [uncultured Gimesia sp.]
MVSFCSQWFWSLKKCRTVLPVLLAMGIFATSALRSPTNAAEEPQNTTQVTSAQLVLAPDKTKPNASKQENTQPETKRPPEVEILSTIEDGGGYGQELHRVTITGIARTVAGDPLKDADIYVTNYAMVTPGDFERLRGHTRSDENGHFELKDIQLLVARQRANPIPKPAEGKFIVFGTKANFGFTWHPDRAYRPDTRPQGTENGDRNAQTTARAFYLKEPINVDLKFDAPAKLRGRITDKQGQPLAGAKVQLGLTDNLRNPGGWGTWSCRFLGNDNDPVTDPISFDGIPSLPAEFRETRTNAQGFYEFTQLRRDSSYLANIDPGPTFDPWRFTLLTTVKDRSRRGEVAVGYDGELNHEFDAPRNVTVHVIHSTTGQPVSNVLVTAHHIGEVRRGGIQARTDSQGNAMLRLIPDKYELIAEPAPDQPFVFLSHQYSVPEKKASEKTDDVNVTLKLRPAAIVKLTVLDKISGQPIPGVRLNYETYDSSTQLPVSTQTVFVDYPKTNAAGEIQAFIEPGMRRFVVAEPLTLAQADGSRGERLKLTGGEITEVRFELTPPQFLPSQLADDEPKSGESSIYPPEIQLKWNTQADLLRSTPLRITTRTLFIHGKALATKALLKDLRSLDPNQLPDISNLLAKHQAGELNWWKQVITAEGNHYREDRYYHPGFRSTHHFDADGQPLPNSSHVTDGWDTLGYDDANNQANVSRRRNGGFNLHIDSPRDLCDWPSPYRYRPSQNSTEKPEIEIHQEGKRIIYEGQSKKLSHRHVMDQETGFIFETSYGTSLDEPDSIKLYFAPTEHPGGLILPRMHISWRMYQGRLKSLRVYLIEKVEVLASFPADAFAIALPTGAMIVDSRHVPPKAAHNGPVRAVQSTLRGPVSDFAAYLNRHPRISHEMENTIQYGTRAPRLKPARWLTADGESAAPDLTGKVVLVEFWGTRCGPCIGQLPEVSTAARYYADQPFVLIGMHDSHTTVEALQKFAQKEKIEYQLAIDQPSNEKGWFGQTMRDYSVRGIPQAAVIDQQGNVTFVGDFNQALRTVDRLLKQKK